MNQRELLDYIRSEHAKGGVKEEIIKHLVGVGYPVADVEKALKVYQKDPYFGLGHVSVLKRRYPLRAFIAILACLAAAFGALCALINMGVIALPVQRFPFNLLYDLYANMQNQFDWAVSSSTSLTL